MENQHLFCLLHYSLTLLSKVYNKITEGTENYWNEKAHVSNTHSLLKHVNTWRGLFT